MDWLNKNNGQILDWMDGWMEIQIDAGEKTS